MSVPDDSASRPSTASTASTSSSPSLRRFPFLKCVTLRYLTKGNKTIRGFASPSPAPKASLRSRRSCRCDSRVRPRAVSCGTCRMPRCRIREYQHTCTPECQLHLASRAACSFGRNYKRRATLFVRRCREDATGRCRAARGRKTAPPAPVDDDVGYGAREKMSTEKRIRIE